MLVERLGERAPTLVGIDQGFSFPLQYFEVNHLKPEWLVFLDDFRRHWPTDDDHVDFGRLGASRVGVSWSNEPRAITLRR
jgi:hypothetical protein